MKKKTQERIILAYVPVLHEGYRRFFLKHKKTSEMFVLGRDITEEFTPLKKDIRALDPKIAAKTIDSMGIIRRISVLHKKDLAAGAKIRARLGGSKVIIPNDEVMREIAAKYFPEVRIFFDDVFLRWDKHKSSEGKPVEVDQEVSAESKDVEIISLLREEAKKSADWWRQIGAAVVKGGKIILSRYNHAVPSELMPYLEGDPRSDFHKGVNVELSTALHCEAGLIVDAAREGISLEGASMYVTTFPCPPCAKLIAYSGIKEVYYAGGYGVLDAGRILKERGIRIIFVTTVKRNL